MQRIFQIAFPTSLSFTTTKVMFNCRLFSFLQCLSHGNNTLFFLGWNWIRFCQFWMIEVRCRNLKIFVKSLCLVWLWRFQIFPNLIHCLCVLNFHMITILLFKQLTHPSSFHLMNYFTLRSLKFNSARILKSSRISRPHLLYSLEIQTFCTILQ